MTDRTIKPAEDGGWKLATPGTVQVDQYFGTRSEAVTQARDAIRDEGGGELRIQDNQDKTVETIPVTVER